MSTNDKKDERPQATQTEPKSGKAKTTHLGYLPADDPVYSTGLLVAGRPIFRKPEKETGNE